MNSGNSFMHNNANELTMTKAEIQHLLNSTEEETANFFDLPEEELDLSYGIGKWTIRQILHHLTDCELIFLERLKRIIAETKQVIWAFNQDQWSEAFDYINEPLKNERQLYQLCRRMIYELMEKYFDPYKTKEFVHSETGLRTLKNEFAKVAWHNKKHNEQIQAALSRGKTSH